MRTNHTFSVGNGNAVKVMINMQIINILKETIFLSNLFENTILGFTLTNYLPLSKNLSSKQIPKYKTGHIKHFSTTQLIFNYNVNSYSSSYIHQLIALTRDSIQHTNKSQQGKQHNHSTITGKYNEQAQSNANAQTRMMHV